MKTRFFSLGLLCTSWGLFGSPLEKVKPFLETYCYDCHGVKKQKGDVRFDTLGNDLIKIENLEIWQGILDQLNLGEMPPRKAPQPEANDVNPVVELLSGELKAAKCKYETPNRPCRYAIGDPPNCYGCGFFHCHYDPEGNRY